MTFFSLTTLGDQCVTAYRKQPVLVVLLALTVLLLLMPDLALAADSSSFSLDKILPSSLKDKNFLEKVITVLVIMVIAGAAIIFGFGAVGSIGDVFSALADARQRGEWGGFLKIVAFVASVLVVSSVLVALVVDWLNNFSISPTITIG